MGLGWRCREAVHAGHSTKADCSCCLGSRDRCGRLDHPLQGFSVAEEPKSLADVVCQLHGPGPRMPADEFLEPVLFPRPRIGVDQIEVAELEPQLVVPAGSCLLYTSDAADE